MQACDKLGQSYVSTWLDKICSACAAGCAASDFAVFPSVSRCSLASTLSTALHIVGLCKGLGELHHIKLLACVAGCDSYSV
jgi:hypothetical protein